MLIKVSDDHWIETDRIVRLYRDGTEAKLSVDFNDRVVTYMLTLPEAESLFISLDEYQANLALANRVVLNSFDTKPE